MSNLEACILLSRQCVAACNAGEWLRACDIMKERDALLETLDAFEMAEFMAVMRPDPRVLVARLRSLETLARNLAIAGALAYAFRLGGYFADGYRPDGEGPAWRANVEGWSAIERPAEGATR